MFVNVKKKIQKGMSRINLEDDDANKTKSAVGPIRWMAPESITDGKYSLKSDVWAFGVTIVEILSHREPYPQFQNMEVVSLFQVWNFIWLL